MKQELTKKQALTKQLTRNQEPIRELSDDELTRVVGGYAHPEYLTPAPVNPKDGEPHLR